MPRPGSNGILSAVRDPTRLDVRRVGRAMSVGGTRDDEAGSAEPRSSEGRSDEGDPSEPAVGTTPSSDPERMGSESPGVDPSVEPERPSEAELADADVSVRSERWATGEVLRGMEAGLVVLAAAAMAICLPLPFHDYLTVNPRRSAGAFYFGPDYHVTGEERARMLALTEHHSHTGLEHFPNGPLDLGLAVGLAALAFVSLLLARRRFAPWLSLLLAFASAVFGAWMALDGVLIHIFQRVVEPPHAAEHVFDAAHVALIGGALALALHALFDLARALVRRARHRATRTID